MRLASFFVQLKCERSTIFFQLAFNILCIIQSVTSITEYYLTRLEDDWCQRTIAAPVAPRHSRNIS